MNHISRHSSFWILLTGLFIGGSVFSFKYFPKAFPILNLTISMNMQEALNEAQKLAHQHNWGPDNFQQAASFTSDEEAKNFIELEGGGKDALNQILQDNDYTLYTWNVRHFKEFAPNETLIKFSPKGTAVGFTEKIEESFPGKGLSTEQARTLAQKEAHDRWHIDFSQYRLIESSQEKMPNGRIDHTLIYEHISKHIGEAEYRLVLVVTGDKLTEVQKYLNIPESFKRRYEKMRSFNNLIASIATYLALILYLFGGCFLGLFFLMRKKLLTWKSPFTWSIALAFLFAVSFFSQFSSIWMNYDTAFAKTTVYMNLLFNGLGSFAAIAFFFGLIFAAAEGLTRIAFPNQIQLWKLWSRKGLASKQVLGRTIGGYLIVGFDFAFAIGIYYCASKYFGWWTPSSSLIDPNILATYAPWIGAVGNSLRAGFMEECLFRAIPLSCAAIIGKKLGNQKIWIACGFVLQALIFGAAHANYPSQPAYARVIELIIPSFVFGGLYLIFGLLPSILSHFLYDLLLFALPIFLSTAHGMWVNKAGVLICALIPLAIVLYARYRQGCWVEIDDSLLNRNWHQPSVQEKAPRTYDRHVIAQRRFSKPAYLMTMIISILAWYWITPFKSDGISLKSTSKSKALHIVRADLEKKEITLSVPWKEFAFLSGINVEQHRFVWQTNKDLYKQLLGNYLLPQQWQVRYAQFDGDIITSAEEYNIFVAPQGIISRISHKLAESTKKHSLSQEEARILAHKTLQEKYNLDPNNLIEVSAISYKKPSRIDWWFIFKDPSIEFDNSLPADKQGQARIGIEITGDTVGDDYTFIFIPEQWQREYRHTQSILNLLKSLCMIIVWMLFIAGGIHGLLQWNNRIFSYRVFFTFFTILIIKSTIQFFNLFPTFIVNFTTSQPFINQLFILCVSIWLPILAVGAGYSLLAAYIQRVPFYIHYQSKKVESLLAAATGASILSSALALLDIGSRSFKPLLPDLSHAAAYVPSLSFALVLFTNFILTTLLYYLYFKCIDHITQGWRTRRLSGSIVALLLGLCMYASINLESILIWLCAGLLFAIVLLSLYIVIIRFDRSTIPLMIGFMSIFSTLQQINLDGFAGVLPGGIMAIVVIGSFSYWWSTLLHEKAPTS